MKAVLVHGFNVKDGGKNTIDQLAYGLAERGILCDTDEADYGYFGLLQIRWPFWRKRRKKVYERLMGAFEQADIIITHSNGAYFTTKALKGLSEAHRERLTVIHISPALNRKTEPPEAVARMLVLHTPLDGWVRASTYLPFHPWGRMGAFGYSGDDPRVTNRKCPQVKRHSDWFHENRPLTLRRIEEFIKEAP